MPDGFLLMDKEGGWTSHDVVAKVRSIVGVRKVGHAGTLDPMATGLLVLAIGRATRLLRFIQELAKTYEAEALFGVATDSLDADGEELERKPMSVTRSQVDQAFADLAGDILQIPPMVSAVKVKGERLHRIARRGEEVEREPRPVTIHDIAVSDFEDGEFPVVKFTTRCSSGTYVRLLADDAASSLGGRGHLTALRRTKIGSLTVGDANSIDQLEACVADGDLESVLISPAQALSHLPSLDLDPSQADLVRRGSRLAAGNGMASGPIRLLDGPDLVAVYRCDGDKLIPEVVLA